jgi:hypothetical protein
MNKKIMNLLALAAFSNANALASDTMTSGCAPEAPWAMQNNVMLFGASLGMSSMKDPISADSTISVPESLTGTVDTTAETNPTEFYVPVGYQADMENLIPSAAKMGFAGRLDVQYGMRQGMFGMFLYAGIGLNQSKTSAKSKAINEGAMQERYDIDAGQALGTAVFGGNNTNPGTYAPFVAADPKVTITSGLNFQVGMRPGIWVNNMFFHGIVGWQCLNLQSKVSNVYKPFARVVEGVSATEPVDNVQTVEPDPALDQFGNLSSFTKNKWTNALVLGAGLDFAHQKWTYGFYYQAAICQRVNFKYNNFAVGATANSFSGDMENITYTQPYAAVPVKVSIQPVISTFMMTVKYAFHKA